MPVRMRHMRRFSLRTAVGLSIVLLVALGVSLTLAWTSSSDGDKPVGTDAPISFGAVDLFGGPGVIVGTVLLQGRSDHSGVLIELDGGDAQTVSGPTGSYVFPVVAPGTHVVGFRFPGYLTHGILVFVPSDQTIIAQTIKLLGGDADGNNVIGIEDLTSIAVAIGTTDPNNDITGDNFVNVQDLVLAGRNFGKMGHVPNSTMVQRLAQVIEAIRSGPVNSVDAAIDLGMETLYGGLRPLPSFDPVTGGVLNQTVAAQEVIAQAELGFANALQQLVNRDDLPPDLTARAFDLKLFVEEMNEVAAAVGVATALCGEGMIFQDQASPCVDLVRLLEVNQPTSLQPSYSVSLRSPVVPQSWTHAWEEDVRLTTPILPGECDTVFKETRGLIVRLHFDRFTIVRDPWVSVFGVPRRTRIPIWSIEWVPSEYVKQWEMCNSGGQIVTNVSQRVKQDIPLNFFWRFYRAN